MHERLMLTSDGDMYEEMRETWRSAQIVTDRRRFPNGAVNVVAFAEPMEDTEMIRHIIEGRLDGGRICGPRLYDVVPESSRHYLENKQSMIKSKAEFENTDPPPAAYWDPVLKWNRAKRLLLFARLLEIGLLRPRLKGTAKHFLGIFFVNKKGKRQKRLILDARAVNWSFVSPPSVNLCSSEAMARIEVCSPEDVEEGVRPGILASRVSSPAWGQVTSETVSIATSQTMSSLPTSGWTLCLRANSLFLAAAWKGAL